MERVPSRDNQGRTAIVRRLRQAYIRAGRSEHRTGTGVLQLEVLVLELVAVDALATSAVVVGEVTTLAHEACAT